MNAPKSPDKPKKSLLFRIGKVFLIVIASIFGLVILVALLIQTPPVQNFARKKINSYMSSKLQTKFEIGRIYIGFPKKIVLEDVYIEDRQKDTLLSGGLLKVDISMLKLLKSEFEVNNLQLENITAKVNRQLPDTSFNFQFIIDAFAPKTPQPATTDTSALKFSINAVSLDKIRILYNDVITGSDMTLWLEHFDTDIKTFDLANMHFDIPDINIRGINAKIYQTKPLVVPEPLAKDMAEAVQPIPFRISLEDINLEDINLDYGNDVSAFYTKLDLGELLVKARNIDLANRLIDIENIRLNNTTAGIRMGNKVAAEQVAEEIIKEIQTEAQNDWRFAVNTIRFDNNNIQFDNDNMPRLNYGMDYAHIKADALTLHVDDFLFSMDSIKGSIKKGQLKEKSGFQLNTFETDFLYAGTEAYLQNLLIETPGTILRRSAIIQYPSLTALQNNIGLLQMNIDLEDSRIQVKDILTFVPDLRTQPAFSNPSATWLVNGNVTGSVSRLNIAQLQIQGLKDTRIDLRGTINGLPDINKLNGNLAINTFRTSRRDIQALAPAGSMPANITLPEIVNLRGSVSGSMANAKANLNIATNLGSAAVNGNIRNATNPDRAEYNATVSTRNLDLGVIMQNDSMFGPLTANIVASGRGFDMKTASANFRGVISSAELNRYTYENVQLNGTLARQQAAATISVDDPNIHLTLNGRSDLSQEFPSVVIDAQIDSIKTLPLNFTTEPLFYHGNITGNFPVTDPKNLEGELLITQSLLITKDQRLVLDSIQLSAGRSDSGQYITMTSDIINFNLTGQYNLTQLGSVFQDAIQPYFAVMPEYNRIPVDPYDFRFTAQVINGPVLSVFVPDLKQLDPVNLQAHFSSTEGWQATANAPLIILGTNRFQNLKLDAGTGNEAITMSVDLQQFGMGTAMSLYATNLTARVADNKINFQVDIKDRNAKDKYILGGIFEQSQQGVYTLSLNSDSLLLNYDKWTINNNNLVRLNNGDINISNFVLGKNDQQLSINSSSQSANSPMEVNFSNFRIGTITGFLKQDTLLADGSINGQVVLNNIATQPTFTSDLTVTDLTINKDTVGNLALKVNNTTQNVFAADVAITGKGNDIAINGNYYVRPANQSSFDLKMDIRQLQLKSIEGATMGALADTKGFLNGSFDISGTIAKPQVDGNLNFNQTGFTLTALNSYFTIDQERININQEGIRFDSFTIRDSSNNTLVLDGSALTTNFANYRFDLDLNADNFRAINSTKRNNQLFYGQLYFDTDLEIKGTESNPVVDGSVKINENTDFTVVLPQAEPGVVSRDGIIRFVDMDSIKIDSVSFASYDSLNESTLKGMNVLVNIEINKEATFSLVIDEGNGDFVEVKGEAALTGGIDPSGKVTLTGSYEIEEGAYELSFNFIQRRFEIEKGSRITWLGEPTRAEVDITAIYVANTAPISLVENQLPIATSALTRYKQKLPFEVYLQLDGELMKPDITFDIVLPEDVNYQVSNDIIVNVDTRLTQLRNEPSEMNKQVFALILLGRFVNENPFDGGGGGGIDAGAIARQSVSKILTQQLNDLASDLIKGVDLNFDVVSTEDYTTGEMRNRTDLNVSLSKQLLNDRLKVTIGSNFELEGPQNSNQNSSNLAGNVALDYMLSKDGRYMLRGYRVNEYQGVIEGYIIETGLNFIITLDYNKFRDLFRRKKKEPAKPVEKNPTENPITTVTEVPEGKLNDE